MDKIKIFGVEINNLTMNEAVDIASGYLASNKLNSISTPNTEIVMAAKEDPELKRLINENDLIIPDGIGLIYGSKIKGNPLKERVTGFDLSIKLLEIANQKGYSLYLLGGKEGVARQASKNIIKQYPNIRIAGIDNGYFKGSHIGHNNHEEELGIIKKINDSKADIIFVGLGFPKQEIWISENRNKISGKLVIGNGGTMDILAGNTKRAPEMFQRLGLEWFYRLVKEPSRIKRQIALPKFILSILLDKDAIQ